MPKTDVKQGDQVTVLLGAIDPTRREKVIAFINLFGAGPFEVKGVGPTEVALLVPDLDKCRNIPHSCVVRVR